MSIEFIMAANELKEVESLRKSLEVSLTKLIQKVGKVSIGKLEQFPFGWRKAAKGRTVWRIIEELITQNLEVHHNEFGISKVTASDSEVSVYDMKCEFDGHSPLYINIGLSLIIVPVSSFVSRIAAVKESSLELMNPPGNAHSPLDRFIKRIFCAIGLIITLSAV